MPRRECLNITVTLRAEVMGSEKRTTAPEGTDVSSTESAMRWVKPGWRSIPTTNSTGVPTVKDCGAGAVSLNGRSTIPEIVVRETSVLICSGSSGHDIKDKSPRQCRRICEKKHRGSPGKCPSEQCGCRIPVFTPDGSVPSTLTVAVVGPSTNCTPMDKSLRPPGTMETEFASGCTSILSCTVTPAIALA